jgi:hypothetical protein
VPGNMEVSLDEHFSISGVSELQCVIPGLAMYRYLLIWLIVSRLMVPAFTATANVV